MATKSPVRRLPPLRWYSLLFISLPVLLIAFGAYVAYLDHTVRIQFEGKRWALPARVYARPLELFQGMKLNPEILAAELNDLGYVQVTQPDGPGAYSRSSGAFRLVTRSFRFWDTSEASQPVTVAFDGNTLRALQNTRTGARLDLVRLDPLLVGGIYPAHHEDRVLVQVKEVPPLLIKALIDVEDRRFYKHHGINVVSILRAMWANLRAGSTVQGGSTLTQQLVKNFYLTADRTLSRKLNEVIMAVLLEMHYSKDEILEAYLNEIFLGQDGQRAIHGFGLASQFYFGRPLNELDISQLALLVGMVRAPSSYEPRQHPQRAIAIRNRVLDAMLTQQDITAGQAAKAKQAPLGVTTKPQAGISPYPAFMDLLRRQLQHDYKEEDLTSEGLQIFTAFDPQIQRAAERALANRIAALEKAYKIPEGKLEGAAIVTDTQNGEVLAMVGGRDARYTGFNRALDAQRPIGSLMKPAIYLTALAQPQKYTLVTPLDDSTFTLKNAGGKPWSPQNYDHQSHGEVPLYLALAHSYNISSARLGLEMGVPRVLKTLYALGVTREFPAYPSTLLGAIELSPLEVTQFYQTLASGGFRTPLRAIRDVLTTRGDPLQRYPLSVEQAADPASAFLVTRAMQEVVRSGTARALEQTLPDLEVAGKTGTTDDLRDSWFAGFSGKHLIVVWLGRDDNEPTGLSGASGALKVWGDIMKAINSESLRLSLPAGVEFASVDPQTQKRLEPGCPAAVELPFITGSAPQDYAPCSGGSPGVIEDTFDAIRNIFQ